MTTLTKSNAKKLAAQNNLSFADLDDTSPVEPIFTNSPQGVINKPYSQHPRKETHMTNEYAHNLAIDVITKNTDPIHPNYRKALLAGTDPTKPDYLGARKADGKIQRYNAVLEQRRQFAVGFDAHPKQPFKALVMAITLAARTNKIALVEMVRTVMQDATFGANIDMVAAERAERAVPSEFIDTAALDALGNTGHEYDEAGVTEANTDGTRTNDDPRADAESAPIGCEPNNRPYDGPSTEDIEIGITGINIFLSNVLAATLTERDREYFACDPLPFYKQWDATQGKELSAMSFPEARALLDAAFKKRISTIPVNNDLQAKLDALAAAA